MQGFLVMDRDRDEAPGHSKRHRPGDVLRHPFPSCWLSHQQPLPHEQGPNTGLSLCLPPGDLPDPAPCAWAAFKESIFSHALWIRVTKLPPLSLRERALWSFTNGIVEYHQLRFCLLHPRCWPSGIMACSHVPAGNCPQPQRTSDSGFS